MFVNSQQDLCHQPIPIVNSISIVNFSVSALFCSFCILSFLFHVILRCVANQNHNSPLDLHYTPFEFCILQIFNQWIYIDIWQKSNVPLAHTHGNANFIFMEILPFYFILNIKLNEFICNRWSQANFHRYLFHMYSGFPILFQMKAKKM